MTGCALVALEQAVAALYDAAVPADPAAALAEAEALLRCEQQLRVLALRRIADVEARGLHEEQGFRDVRSWLRDRRPDGEVTDAHLGSALREFPLLTASVEAGECSLSASRKVVHVLRLCRRHVDTGTGLIDGLPSEQVLPAVVHHVVTLTCRYLHGLAADDPRLLALQARVDQILEAGGPELARLEAAFTLLAEQVPLPALTGLLDELLVSLVPSILEARAEAGREAAGLVLHRRSDGSGWRMEAQLDLECGERLFTALRAEAARDPRNPVDTALWLQTHADGLQPHDEGAEVLRPRDKRRRLHDALNRLLERYLSEGLGGTLSKVPVQISVMLPEVAGGQLPARGDSGTLIPRSMVRRWWCDSQVTAYVMSLGGKALRTMHGQRTLTRRERVGLHLETGGQCAGLGCCRDGPNPLQVLRPHHVHLYSVHGRTGLEETIYICDWTHRAIHQGKTVLLRDGRYLSEAGISGHPEGHGAKEAA